MTSVYTTAKQRHQSNIQMLNEGLGTLSSFSVSGNLPVCLTLTASRFGRFFFFSFLFQNVDRGE